MRAYVAVTEWTEAGRVARCQDFDTLKEAEAFVVAAAERFPDAFAAQAPQGDVPDWTVDAGAGTLAYDPPPPPVVPYREARARAFAEELSDGRPTEREAIGDMIDALATEVAALRAQVGGGMTDDLAGKLAKIQEIKARYPKET